MILEKKLKGISKITISLTIGVSVFYGVHSLELTEELVKNNNDALIYKTYTERDSIISFRKFFLSSIPGIISALSVYSLMNKKINSPL